MSSTPRPITDYASALDWLMRQINYERTSSVPYQTAAFKLDRMRLLLALVGDPHLGLRAVHLAGTKGKGSTAAMVAAVLQAAGMRTGLYTSPHLEAIEERIAIDGARCSQEEFAALAAELEGAVAKLPRDPAAPELAEPTFFEITTAMAFLHFARRRVDAAVLEVGLGGRLDSTNVCHPCVSVITSISFDHMRQLGNTLAAIAGEKAGILKRGVPVVSGVVQGEPREVIRRVAAQSAAPLFERGLAYDFAVLPEPRNEHQGEERFDYREPAASEVASGGSWRLADVRLGMLGQHQAANAAAAIAAVRRLVEQGWSIEEDAMRRGLSAARCPARIEVVGEQPTVILDVAHNVASIAALLEVLRERFPQGRRVLVFASSKDKDTSGMLRLLVPEFERIVLTRYIHNPRAVEPQRLLELAREVAAELPAGVRPAAEIADAPTPDTAWELAQRATGRDDLICITGSFFLAAELRPLVGGSRLDAGNTSA
jgi:dihydrofolate synthase/folylpolyglutamate synthase